MKILAIEKELKDVNWTKENSLLKNEAGAVYQLYLNKIIREIYFTQNKTAILILECDSIEHSNTILKTLPLIQEGFISFELLELNPYTGFSRLMD